MQRKKTVACGSTAHTQDDKHTHPPDSRVFSILFKTYLPDFVRSTSTLTMAHDARSTMHAKLVLLGNAGVGKSCLVLRCVRWRGFWALGVSTQRENPRRSRRQSAGWGSCACAAPGAALVPTQRCQRHHSGAAAAVQAMEAGLRRFGAGAAPPSGPTP